MSTVSIAPIAGAQSTGRRNEAIIQSTVDAASLVAPSRLTFMYGEGGGLNWIGGASVGIRTASVRAVASGAFRDHALNLGYARRLIAFPVARSVGVSAGLDLAAGSDVSRALEHATSRAARAMVPVALHLRPSDHFFAVGYLAPYAEMGRAPSYSVVSCQGGTFDCLRYDGIVRTDARGIGAGFHLRAWFLGLDGGIRDGFDHRIGSGPNPYIATLSLQF